MREDDGAVCHTIASQADRDEPVCRSGGLGLASASLTIMLLRQACLLPLVQYRPPSRGANVNVRLRHRRLGAGIWDVSAPANGRPECEVTIGCGPHNLYALVQQNIRAVGDRCPHPYCRLAREFLSWCDSGYGREESGMRAAILCLARISLAPISCGRT